MDQKVYFNMLLKLFWLSIVKIEKLIIFILCQVENKLEIIDYLKN